MRKYLLIASVVFLLPFVGFSQYYWDYGMKLGGSNYLGDIGGIDQHRRNFILDMKMQETRWDIGGYVRYKLRDPWSVEAQLNWVRISGADSLTTRYDPRRGRNLNFRNDIIAFSAFGEWTFFENPDLGNTYRYENAFSAFLFAGFSIFYQDPYAYNPYHDFGLPTWVSLHGLRTEDQLYNSKFHLIQPGIPIGAGFNFTIKKKYRIGWSLTWTKTFTDYLDGISGNYPSWTEWNTLTPVEKYFSDRTTPASVAGSNGVTALGDYGPSNNPNKLNQRGIITNKDNFITTTVDVGYVIRGRSNVYRAHYSGLFSKNRFKIRRRRAKF